MTEPTSFKSHNFDAVNEQIQQIAKRERARTFAYRLKSFQTIFMYAAAVALIIAMLILVGAWAKRIISAPYYPPKTEIVRPEVIEKEVLKVVQVPVERSILESAGSGYDGPVSEATGGSSGSGGTVITDYNTFKTTMTEEFSSSGFTEVVTGWRYADSNNDKKITNGELIAYLKDNVSEEAFTQNREQDPMLAGDPDKVLMSYR